MKQKYSSPLAKITKWEDEIFLTLSVEQQDNVFGWVW